MSILKQREWMPIIIILLVSAGIVACSQKGIDPTLRKKVMLIEQAPALPIPAVMPFTSEPFHAYGLMQERSPFQAIANEVTSDVGKPLLQSRDELQRYNLNQLTMVGTLMQHGQYWALIKTPAGIVKKALVGQYIGTNYAKIIDIMPDKMILQEKLSNKTGWYERKAELLLVKRVN